MQRTSERVGSSGHNQQRRGISCLNSNQFWSKFHSPSPNLSLYRIVVFPAASRPTIKILISFFPNYEHVMIWNDRVSIYMVPKEKFHNVPQYVERMRHSKQHSGVTKQNLTGWTVSNIATEVIQASKPVFVSSNQLGAPPDLTLVRPWKMKQRNQTQASHAPNVRTSLKRWVPWLICL